MARTATLPPVTTPPPATTSGVHPQEIIRKYSPWIVAFIIVLVALVSLKVWWGQPAVKSPAPSAPTAAAPSPFRCAENDPGRTSRCLVRGGEQVVLTPSDRWPANSYNLCLGYPPGRSVVWRRSGDNIIVDVPRGYGDTVLSYRLIPIGAYPGGCP